MTYTLTKNEAYNSLEIAFDSIPSKAIRESLKALRFRWNPKKSVWYGFAEEETIKNALDGKPTESKEITKKAPTNYLGVKVGDVFHASWGYDQTNNDFFQVTEIVGNKMVRVVEVCPSYEVNWASGMAEDRTLQKFDGSMLPRASRSIFVKDQEKGDLHKVLEGYGKEKEPYLKLDSVCWAYPCKSGETYYESWYA